MDDERWYIEPEEEVEKFAFFFNRSYEFASFFKLRSRRMEQQESSSNELHNSNIHIPHDIMVDILARVPAKSLMRFMCVCKTWYSLIHDDTDFAELHQLYSRTRYQGSYFTIYWVCRSRKNDWKFGSREKLIVSFMDHESQRVHNSLLVIPRRYRYHRPVNGLVCIYRKMDPNQPPFVFNASTRQVVTLPEYDGYDSWETAYHGCLCYLCFDPVTKAYKVLHLIKDSSRLKCQIYTIGGGGSGTSSSSSWRKLEVPREYLTNIWNAASSVSSDIHGAIYWLCCCPRLIVFDVDREVFCSFTLSEPVYSKTLLAHVAPGQLATIPLIPTSTLAEDDGPEDDCLSIWILEVDRENEAVFVRDKIDLNLDLEPTLLPKIRRIRPRLRFGGIGPTGKIFLVDDLMRTNLHIDLERKQIFKFKNFRLPETCEETCEGAKCLHPSMTGFHNNVENLTRFR